MGALKDRKVDKEPDCEPAMAWKLKGPGA